MRLESDGQRSALRTRLLLGVASAVAAASTAALADPAPAAPPSDPDKWLPYSDLGGEFGSGMTAGKADIFAPVWQDLDSLIFVDMGLGTETKANVLYNLGAGYRTKIDPDWVLGVYANYDRTQLEDNNTFKQGQFGAELMSADWDVRINGYLADTNRRAISGNYELYIHNTEIAVLQGEDVGYSGFDGEVGYRIFSTDSADVRFFVGGFSFSHSGADTTSLGQNFDFSYHSLTGPKARAEVTVYDIDALGMQSRVTLDGEVAHDDVRKTTSYFGATLRIPLGDFSGSSGAQALDELDRRMVDPERRNDSVLTRWQYTKPEPVVIYGAHMTSQPTNTLLYVDNTVGAGTYANPTTLSDATSRATTNAFIVLTDKQGPIVGGATMQAGQSIVGGGETFTVKGTKSGATFSHDFAPDSGPTTVIPATAGGDGITLASNTNLYGFSIKGDFGDAVYGKDVTGVNIRNLAIDGTGGGNTGIDIIQDKSGPEYLNISNVTISNVSDNGIYISNKITDGGSSVESIALDNITITNAGGDGIFVGTYAGAGTSISQNLSISNATISGVYNTGIAISTAASGVGASVNQTVAISGTNVSNAGFEGIYVGTYASGGASASESLSVSDTGITDIGANAGAFAVGLDIYTMATGVGSTINQTVSVSDTNVSYVHGPLLGIGMYFGANARDGASVIQSLSISGSSATHNDAGLVIEASAYDNGYGVTTAFQSAQISNSNFSNNSEIGAVVVAYAGSDVGGLYSQAAISQNVSFSYTTFNHNGETGLGIYEQAFNGASANQYIQLYGVQIEHNGGNGVAIEAEASYLGFAGQTVEFNANASSYNEIAYNGGNGIYIRANASAGGLVQQNISIYNTNITNNKGDGISISNYSGRYAFSNYSIYYSHIQQNLIVAYGSISSNGGNGIEIQNNVYYGAGLDQIVELYRETISKNAGDGILENSVVTTYKPGSGYDFAAVTNMTSNLYIYDSNIIGNGMNGIEINTSVFAPHYLAATSGYSYVEQHVTVSGSTIAGNAGDGFVASAYERGVYALDIQYVTLSDSYFGHNGNNGAAFYAHAVYGPGGFGDSVQDVTIESSDFVYNGGNGLYAFAGAYERQGRAEQHFTVDSSYFDFNGGAGISLRRVAENGVYLPGYACTGIQGLPGGCAFVRQSFRMYGGSASYNGGNGISISNYAKNFGAIYAESGRPIYTPTVFLEDVSANYNKGAGLYSSTQVRGNSYAYHYILAIDSSFNHNNGDGFQTKSYASGNSTMVERNFLYSYFGTTASYNKGNGVEISNSAPSAGAIYSQNIFSGHTVGIEANSNGIDGVKISTGYDPSGTSVLEHNYFYFNTFADNAHDGVALYANGPGAGKPIGAGQFSLFVGNAFNTNGADGLYGLASNGAYQSVNFKTGGNAFSGNHVGEYDFNTLAGGVQHVY